MTIQIYNKIFNWWTKFANREEDFFSTDTKELYQKNLSVNYEQLDKFGWIENKFTYKFNSHGFRCHEFQDNSILFLGCSVTQGIGIPIEFSFPEIISKQLNLPCSNLGLERTSANTAFRLAYHFLPKLKPKICVASLIYPHRLELLLTDRAIHFIPNHKFQDKDNFSTAYYVDYYNKWITTSENFELNYLKNVLAIHQLCEDYNIKFINLADLMPKQKIGPMVQDKNSQGRDLVHPGIDTHEKIARTILTHL